MNGRRLTGSSRTPAMALRLPLEVRENHRNAQVQRFTKAVRPAIWPDVQFSSGHCVGPGSNSPCFARYSSGVTQADEVGGLPTSSLCCRAEPLRRQRLSGIHLRTSRRQYPWPTVRQDSKRSCRTSPKGTITCGASWRSRRTGR